MGGELGSPIRDYILRQTIESKYMITLGFCSFKGCRQFGQRDQTTGLGKAVNDGENGGVASGRRQVCDKVYGYM